MAPAASTGLQHLDDHVLLWIMKWLDRVPDIFNLSQCCTRLKRLAHDTRNWLIVGPGGGQPQTPAGCPWHYRTLADAVHASRPGDTIMLSPGSHACSGIVLKHCLTLLGPGSEATKAVLVGQTTAEPTLDIRAACRLTGLTITSQVAPCVLHRSGALRLEGCHLTCDARGLDHLCAPLVTCAVNTSHDVKDGIDGQGGVTVLECLLEGAAVLCPVKGLVSCRLCE